MVQWFIEKKVDQHLLSDVLTHKDREKISKRLRDSLSEPTKKLGQIQSRLYDIKRKVDEGKVKPEEQQALTKEYSDLQERAGELQRKIESVTVSSWFKLPKRARPGLS